MTERIERAARAGWDYAERREQRIAEREGADYKPVPWEKAHPLDQDEYREYVGVILTAANGVPA
jgi:hypothetical protein